MALFATLVVIPVAASIHAVCFLLDNLLFPGLRRQKVEAPVFIVGHARSGTTLMQRLMTSDRERFSYFLAYEMFFPSLLEKKLIRLLGRIDRRFLGGRIEGALRAQEDETLARTRDMHETGLFSPEEDDFVLTSPARRASGWSCSRTWACSISTTWTAGPSGGASGSWASTATASGASCSSTVPGS